MKKTYLIFTFLLSILLLTAFSNNPKDSSKQESNISVALDSLEMKVPCDWTILNSSQFEKNSKETLYIETAGYDEKKLKKAFGYDTTEKCVRSFLPNGVYLKSKKAQTFDIEGLPIFQYECTIDKYSKSEKKFIKTNEVVYLDFIIDNSKKEIYIMYFLNNMADNNKIREFFSTMKYHKEAINNKDMLYRWQLTN